MCAVSHTKICSRCKKEKLRAEFSKRSAVKDGLNAWCKACQKEAQSEWKSKPENAARHRELCQNWYAQNPDRLKELNRRWSQENRDRSNARHQRYVARRAGGGGSYTEDEWRELCASYDNCCLRCGKQGKLTADHVIPVSQGGSSDISNIQPLCKGCNSAKKDRYIDYRPMEECYA